MVRTVSIAMFSALFSALALGCGGAAKSNTAAASAPPQLTNAEVVAPTVSVAPEIAASCKLENRDALDPTEAPSFDFDDSALHERDREILARVAECVTGGALSGRRIELVGRADPRGATEYNMALGAKRAGTVAEYLARLGVERGRVFETSRGELDATGTDEASWRRDRRVDVRLAP